MAKGFTIPSIFTAVDKFTAPVKKMAGSLKDFVNRSEEEVARFERKWSKIGDTALNVAKKSAIVGAAIAAPLIIAARDAIAFEDRMADVAKTSGMAGKELSLFGKDLLSLAPETRTSIEGLQKISEIGGALGIKGRKDLLGFTDATNKFNVALGSDFSGGLEDATKSIGGLKTLFKETRDIKIDEAITKAGSAINALSSKGVQVPELTEFMARVGQLPDALKPSIQNTAALGAVLNKVGITAEIGSRAFSDILTTASQNIPKFAKQMKISNDAASELINSDPTKFATKFAASLNGLNAQGLSKTLKSLKLTDIGAIKVVGALGSSVDMLTEFQGISNDEFAKGTSLLNEYNTKNNTTKAGIEKAINNFKALSITIGTELLPIINDLIKKFVPVVKSFLQWSQDNPKTLRTIVAMAVGIAALSFVVSGVSSAIFIFSKMMLIWNGVTKAATAAQWLWNAAMTANPIGLIIVGVAALIALVTAMIIKWNEWGAALAVFLGPLGLAISLIQSFRRNWEMITEAFTKDGIIAGIKAIGKTILDAILMPVQQITELLGKWTGIEAFKNVAKAAEFTRDYLGVNTESNENEPTEVLNPEASRQEALVKRLETTQTFNSRLLIEDKTGRGMLQNDNPMISLSPQLGSTLAGW